MNDYSNWLQSAEKITLEAGRLVEDLYKNPGELQFKEGLDGRPSTITEADSKSEGHVVSHLQQKFPKHGVYGEEGTDINSSNEYCWYVDPIDGTTNFWRHIPLFGISVGLAHKKRPVLGVLHFPALSLTVSAYKGGGTSVNGEETSVSNRSLDKALYYFSCQEARNGQAFPALAQEVGWIKAIDSSSYEFAQIAMGDAELYTFFKKTPHDMVAGAIIIEEAGGRVTDEKGHHWTTDSEIIVASNGVVHDEALTLMSERK